MSYVWACYIAGFGVLLVCAARLVVKSRDVAAKVLARGDEPQADPDARDRVTS